MVNVEILTAGRDDCISLAKLQAEAFDIPCDDKINKYFWMTYILQGYTIKAVVNNVIVGGIGTFPTADNKWYIGYVFVNDRYKKLGIARKMMNYILDNITIRPMVLTVVTDKPYLVVFYESFGFKIIKKSINHYQDNTDRFIMEAVGFKGD